ncbi:hypothetical protein GCM10023149_50670 [Mucilaginibacter gynuensis]|uniref:Uncharacterized protein n=1 Tax=Mucilaginibacter gynuensis TaxID=1302236 RepID=A0ABP8HIB4_9SPHI
MEQMKSLADQLREQLAKPAAQQLRKNKSPKGAEKKSPGKPAASPAILNDIHAYDTTGNKSMVHARFDSKTVDILNKFKMATGVDVSKTVAFAVHHFLSTQPEIKTIIKQYIQNTDL